MRRQRRILLALLGASLLAASLGSFLYVQIDRLRLMDEQIAFLRRQYRRLPPDIPRERASLQERILEMKRAQAGELDRYYADGEMDLYRFGSLLNALLSRHGITVDRYRTVGGSSAPVLEVSTRELAGVHGLFFGCVGVPEVLDGSVPANAVAVGGRKHHVRDADRVPGP